MSLEVNILVVFRFGLLGGLVKSGRKFFLM